MIYEVGNQECLAVDKGIASTKRIISRKYNIHVLNTSVLVLCTVKVLKVKIN
jgi:hypothetical protein